TQLQPAVVLDSSGALDRPHSFPTRRSSDLSPGRNKGMNPQEYDRMRQLEDWYWWFVARREAALRFTEDFRPSRVPLRVLDAGCGDRKSTRLNSSHGSSSYAVFCLKKKIDVQ